MKRKYELQGMSCERCISNVKKKLLQLPVVEDAEVHLHPQTAVLTITKPIDVSELQTQLSKAGHYMIKEVS